MRTMMTVAEWKQTLKAGKLDKKLKQLYGDDAAMLVHQKKRYAAALDEFAKLYPQRKQVGIFSAPGRTEVGGNHTAHQHGCVLAAAGGTVGSSNLSIIIQIEILNISQLRTFSLNHNRGTRRRHIIINLFLCLEYTVCLSQIKFCQRSTR